MKTIKNYDIIISVMLFLFALSVGRVQAQEQGLRWSKWSRGQNISGGGGMADEVIDSYVDSLGNTYIFGECGMGANLGTYLVENGPEICPMDSTSEYMMDNVFGVFLAKIDSAGTILWCKCVRAASNLTIPWNMVVKGNRITIAFDTRVVADPYNPTGGPLCWLYFCDTLLIASGDRFYKNEWVTYFVTFDLDGNRIDVHDVKLWAKYSPDSQVFTTCRLGGLRDSRFAIDDEGSFHLFSCTTGCYLSEDSLHKAYIIVDDDTNRKYLLNIHTQGNRSCFPSVYYKMSNDWHLLDMRYMIDSVAGWQTMSNYSRAALIIENILVEGDDMYLNGHFDCTDDAYYIAQEMADTDSFSATVYLDSVHYLKIENTRDFSFMPFLIKLNKSGDIVWVQQLYTESPDDEFLNYYTTGKDGLAMDEDNVYTQYWARDRYLATTQDSSECATFFLDSTHTLPLATNHSTNHIVIVGYDKISGAPFDYYYVDPTAVTSKSQSLAVLGDELILDVGFFYYDYTGNPAVRKTELCRINKYTKEMRRSTPINYTRTPDPKSMSINSNGWVFRGEEGEAPRLYDSIPIGPTVECVVMSFYYDSTLDTRIKPCPKVDSLWGSVSQHTATLQWSSTFSHAVYELAYIPDGDDWDNATILEVPDTTASITLPDDPGMGSYQCYQFRLRGRCDGRRVASSPWSEPISLCVEVVVEGIDDVENPSGISLSPNPTTGRVSIQGLHDTPLYITLFDLSGRPLETYRHTTAFDISHLPQGSYLAELHLPDGEVHRLKLIKK